MMRHITQNGQNFCDNHSPFKIRVQKGDTFPCPLIIIPITRRRCRRTSVPCFCHLRLDTKFHPIPNFAPPTPPPPPPRITSFSIIGSTRGIACAVRPVRTMTETWHIFGCRAARHHICSDCCLPRPGARRASGPPPSPHARSPGPNGASGVVHHHEEDVGGALRGLRRCSCEGMATVRKRTQGRPRSAPASRLPCPPPEHAHLQRTDGDCRGRGGCGSLRRRRIALGVVCASRRLCSVWRIPNEAPSS